MDIDKDIEIPIEEIVTHIDIKNKDFFDQHMAVKMAKNHYEEEKFIVMDGKKFEENMLLFLFDDRRKYADDYIKVKIGRAKINEDVKAFADMMISAMPEHAVNLFLYLCRFCSYIEGPVFPDLMVLTQNGKMWLKYVIADEMEKSQKMFLLLAKLLSADIQVVQIVNEAKERIMTINPRQVLESVISDNRAFTVLTGIEESMNFEKKKLEKADVSEILYIEDEISYLLEEKQKYPFFMIKNWLSTGHMEKEDLMTNVFLITTTNLNEKHAFEHFTEELRNDNAFAEIRENTEDAVRKKADYIQEKFSLGESRTKALLRFLEY